MKHKLYETDYCIWAETNAQLLQAGRLAEVDIEHLIEELNDVGKSERRSLQSYLELILLHLLKWQFQPPLRSHSWRLSIENGRQGVEKILDDSPSLRPTLPVVIDKAYSYARRSAAVETGLGKEKFPPSCPFTLEEILDDSFLPIAQED